MKTIKTLITAVTLAAIASTASATMTFEQSIPHSAPLALLEEGDDYGYTFNSIVKSGGSELLQNFLLNNTSYYIASAVVEVSFADKAYWDNDKKDQDEWWKSTLYEAELEYALVEIVGSVLSLNVKSGDEATIGGATEVDGSHYGGYDYRTGNIDSSDFDELEDGKAEFKVTAQEQAHGKGDFYVKTAKLTVTVEKMKTPPHGVPDTGATAILLGTALLGLAAVRRKLGK